MMEGLRIAIDDLVPDHEPDTEFADWETPLPFPLIRRPREDETGGVGTAPLALLDQGLEALGARWSQGGTAKGGGIGQARAAVQDLKDLFGVTDPAEVTSEHIRGLTEYWEAQGFAASTIHRRLSALSVLGISVRGCRPPLPYTPKRYPKPRPVDPQEEETPAREKTELDRLLTRVAKTHWAHRRSFDRSMSQGNMVLEALHSRGLTTLPEVTPEVVRELVDLWTRAGYARGTIMVRCAILNLMGVPVQGCRPRGRQQLKWWLNPTERERLLGWLRGIPDADYGDTADYIEWTCYTGLRVEETLRLTWRDITFNHGPDGRLIPEKMAMTAPGTKTANSQAALPLGKEACLIIVRRREAVPEAHPGDRVFPIGYRKLANLWSECREFIGAQDVPTATLKALRRSAARYLHVDRGMPLELTRAYLRHGSVGTTMGYLKLTGGYGTEEMARWL